MDDHELTQSTMRVGVKVKLKRIIKNKTISCKTFPACFDVRIKSSHPCDWCICGEAATATNAASAVSAVSIARWRGRRSAWSAERANAALSPRVSALASTASKF